ncbi:hypothetical protein GcC1_134001 [Golovinomyces cichoracearum]|uniref:Uncharacterized protein n=1 Tax=Golovinomyces cichoracearum TaxID=62708 RepID=A0A420I394_9PEZI|nr:hypothetical protein GcC1_134001 [Golovinomyces cichoracearum]
MEPSNKNSTEDPFLYTEIGKKDIENHKITNSSSTKLRGPTLELPSFIEHLVNDKSDIQDHENDRTFLDDTIEENFTFPGMTLGWNFKRKFNRGSILYRIDMHNINKFDIESVLHNIAANKDTNVGINYLENEDDMNLKSIKHLEIWAIKNPESSQKMVD